MRSGVLITFPDIDQANLNRLTGEIYLARISQTQDKAQQARACLDLLMNTRATTCEQLGTDKPGELAQMLRGCKTDVECAALNNKLAGVRLFSLDRRIMRESDLEFNQFPQIMAFWRSRSGPYPAGETRAYTRLEQFAETYLN
jgi:intracellular multiplication protein IcmJ